MGLIFYMRSIVIMMHRSIPRRRPRRLPIFLLKLSLPIMIFCALAALNMRFDAAASTQPARKDMHTMAGDTCAAATVINPAALPFFDEATNAGAANDIDPGPSACAPGPGSDVVYSFTPAATDRYRFGAPPPGSS